MSLSTTDFGLHMKVASLEATEEMMMAEASSPHAPYNSATMETHTHPSVEHLGSLAWCFLASMANTLTSKRVRGFSSEVIETSSAAVLPTS